MLKEKIITSCNLCSIPFLGHTDTTRLQMASKQLGQSLSHLNCEIPKVLGSNFRYLNDVSSFFKLIAPENGEVLYRNKDFIIIIYFYPSKEELKVYDVPNIKVCSSLNSVQLRYCRNEGKFNKGDLIYEYCTFKNNLPSYGYNLLTAYMPFFGFNHEDSIIVSEDVANKCKSLRFEHLIIPVYTYSIFKKNYNSILGFLPDIGQQIDGSIITLKSTSFGNKNSIPLIKSLNITDFSTIFDNNVNFMSVPIVTKIKNGIVSNIIIHKICSKNIIDKKLQDNIEKYYLIQEEEKKKIIRRLVEVTGKTFTKYIASKYYYLLSNIKKLKYNIKDLVYVIELELYSERESTIGDKFANRYANKGIISLIIPNELRPIALESNKPIDYISGPISVFSRMNFGQIPEGMVSKAILKSEETLLNDPSQTYTELRKLSELASVLGDTNYSQEIYSLSEQIKNNKLLQDTFITDVKNNGLYFEAPNFANFDFNQLEKLLNSKFNIHSNEDVLIKRELLLFIKNKLELRNNKINFPLPDNDIILKQIFVAPIYTLKLKQEADSRITSRDFGAYNIINKQPKQGRGKGGTLAQGSKLGQMEFDGLIGHGCMKTIKELRTVKNDAKSLKLDLANQILSSGNYVLSDKKSPAVIKLIIDGLIEFISS